LPDCNLSRVRGCTSALKSSCTSIDRHFLLVYLICHREGDPKGWSKVLSTALGSVLGKPGHARPFCYATQSELISTLRASRMTTAPNPPRSYIIHYQYCSHICASLSCGLLLCVTDKKAADKSPTKIRLGNLKSRLTDLQHHLQVDLPIITSQREYTAPSDLS
jgi:hypothetical protein